MSRRKKEQDPEPEGALPEAADLPDEEGEPETDGPEYSNCACGARLVLEEEIQNGKCEQCQPLAPIPEEPEAPSDAEPASAPAPAQMSLLPPEPFDEEAALKDIFAKTRTVEAYRRLHEEAKERTADLKKQWESAAKTCEQATTEYERKYRAWVEAEERQQQLVDAYEESVTAAAPIEDAPDETTTEAPAEAPVETAPAA